MTEEVALRPVREDDLQVLEELTQYPERTGEFEWFGWSDLRHLVARRRLERRSDLQPAPHGPGGPGA